MAVLRNVAKTDTLEVQRQKINLIASDIYGVLAGSASISVSDLSLSDGSRLDPSLNFSSDSLLGLYKSGSREFSFSSNGQTITSFSDTSVTLNKNLNIERTELSTAQLNITDPGSDYVANTYSSVTLYGGSGNSAEASITVTEYVGSFTSFHNVNNYVDGSYTGVSLIGNTRFNGTITTAGAGYINGLYNVELYNVPTDSFVITTIANPGTPPPNNVYVVDGVTQDTITLTIGNTYRFDVSDSTNVGHPINFSDALDQPLSSNDFVVKRYLTEGSTGAFVDLIIKPSATAQTIKYYCANHAGMGGNITVISGTAGNYGDGAFADVEYTAGALSSFAISQDGSDYNSGDVLTIPGGTALAQITLSGGVGTTGSGAVANFDIVTVDLAASGAIINGGTGYLPGFYQNVPFTLGSGNGKLGNITVSGEITIGSSNNGTSVTGYTPGSYIATSLFNKPTNTYSISLVQREEIDFHYGSEYTCSVSSNSSNTDWTFSGDFTGLNPTINLVKGDVVTFTVTTLGRPFSITSGYPYSSAEALSSPEIDGASFPLETGSGSSTFTLDTQYLTPGTYYYYSTLQPTVMYGEIVVSEYSGTNYAVGDTITGSTSGASGVITYVALSSASGGLFRVATVSNGPFQAGEPISNGTVTGFAESQDTVDVFNFGSTERLTLTKGNTYRFDASDPSNADISPYVASLSFNPYDANLLSVITEGTPGTAGSFYDVVINPNFSDSVFQIIPFDTTGTSTLNLTRSLINSTSGSIGQYTLGMKGNAFVSGLGVIPSFQLLGSFGSNYKTGDILELSPLITGGTGFEATITSISYLGYVSSVQITTTGTGYLDGDVLSVDDADIGNVGGSGFQYRLSSTKEIDNFTFVSKGTNHSKNDLLTIPRAVDGVSTTLDSLSNQITVASTVGIYDGFILEKVSGAGDIAAATTVTSVIDGTTLEISSNPTVDGAVILNFVPPYGRNSGFEYQISEIGVVESITLTNNGVGYEAGDILYVDRQDLVDYAGPYTFTSDLEITVNSVSTENVISGNVSTGNFTAESFIGNSASISNGVINNLTSPNIIGNQISLNEIDSTSNISISTPLELNIETSRINIGTSIDIIPDSGNILTSGSVQCSSITTNNVITIDSDISSSGSNDIVLTPATLRVVKIDSTSGLQIPAGTTAQRPQPGVVANGSIRYNTTTNQYEGYSASTASWSSLGGVRDLDGNTYILAEQFTGANDNTFYFYNDNQNTIQLSPFGFNFQTVKTISSVNVSAPTYGTWTENTPVNLGEYFRYRNNIYVVSVAGTTADSTNPPTHSIGSQLNGTAELTWNSLAVDDLTFDGIKEVKIGPFKNTPLVVSEELKLLNDTISTLNNDLKIQPPAGKKAIIDSSTSLVIPSGNTSERGIPLQGAIRYNSQLSSFEGYNGANWTSLGGVKDVDGNTYIIPETAPGSNENILYFYNDNDNTIQVSKTAFNFKTIDVINSDSNNLDLNVSNLSLNNDITSLSVNSSITKLQTTSNSLEFGVSSGLNNDTILKLDDSGDINFNNTWGSGSPSYIKLFKNNLKEFELTDMKVSSFDVVLTKGTTDSGLVTIFDPSIHSGAKLLVTAFNTNTNDTEIIEYTITSKASDIFHTEYGNVVSGDNIISYVFDFDSSNNVRFVPSLLNSVSNGDVINITAIVTIIKK